jgi:hypothetical protein
MSLLTPKTTLQADLSAKDARVLQCAEAAHHLASMLRNSNAWLWGLPPVRLLAILNADVASTQATFAANSALGAAVNSALDTADLPEFPTRAPVAIGRADLLFDGNEFSILPTAAPPPAPAAWPDQEG